MCQLEIFSFSHFLDSLHQLDWLLIVQRGDLHKRSRAFLPSEIEFVLSDGILSQSDCALYLRNFLGIVESIVCANNPYLKSL